MIGDTGDPRCFHAAVDGGNGFGDSGHPDGIRSQTCHHPDFGRRFKLGAGRLDIHPFVQRQTDPLRRTEDPFLKTFAVHLAHVREAGAQKVRIVSPERGGDVPLDVIGDDHEAAGSECRIDPSGRIGQKEFPDTQHPQQTDRHDRFFDGDAFVVVESSGGNDFAVGDLSENKNSFVECRPGKIGDFAVVDDQRIFDTADEAVPTGTGDQGDFRLETADFVFQKTKCVFKSFFHGLYLDESVFRYNVTSKDVFFKSHLAKKAEAVYLKTNAT